MSKRENQWNNRIVQAVEPRRLPKVPKYRRHNGEEVKAVLFTGATRNKSTRYYFHSYHIRGSVHLVNFSLSISRELCRMSVLYVNESSVVLSPHSRKGRQKMTDFQFYADLGIEIDEESFRENFESFPIKINPKHLKTNDTFENPMRS